MNQNQIGKFIAELRKNKHMTQAELGEKLGVTNKTVSRWENGNYMPDLSLLAQLARELGVSVNELLCGSCLKEADFKQKADHNLIVTFSQIKQMKHERSVIDFFTGAGTGIVVSCLLSPDSVRRTWAILAGIGMIGTGWYRKSKYDRTVINRMEELSAIQDAEGTSKEDEFENQRTFQKKSETKRH